MSMFVSSRNGGSRRRALAGRFLGRFLLLVDALAAAERAGVAAVEEPLLECQRVTYHLQKVIQYNNLHDRCNPCGRGARTSSACAPSRRSRTATGRSGISAPPRERWSPARLPIALTAAHAPPQNRRYLRRRLGLRQTPRAASLDRAAMTAAACPRKWASR